MTPASPLNHHSTGSESEEIIQIAVPYQSDGSRLYTQIKHLPQAIWLDSGAHQSFSDGRYDIFCAQPIKLLKTIGQTTTIYSIDENSPEPVIASEENPFDLVETELEKLPRIESSEIPFTGGAMGYFGYHLNRHIEKLPPPPEKDLGLPDMQVGIYDWALIQDHQNQSAYLVFLPSVNLERQKHIKSLLQRNNNEKSIDQSFYINMLESNHNLNSYSDIIAKIQLYIRSGDIYQVNFAQRFTARYRGDLFHAYKILRQLLPSPYSGFMAFDEGAILSHSPELFIQVDGKDVVTKPIKGTRPRGKSQKADLTNLEALLDSPKDRAENLMIVDLLRNDLGKHCVPGSISVPELFALRSYENVHHLVSTVTGKLNSTSSPLQLLRDSFPGGSITGAPKIRAMEIINEVEDQERSAYCGSLGYISTNGKMATNVAIRTLVANSEKIVTWGGGGIVADSDAEAEYQESIDKIGILLNGLPRDQA